MEDFINNYRPEFKYEIIKDKPKLRCDKCKAPLSLNDKTCVICAGKDKPSLNGHYCLATKEHYDKLVEDGYDDCTIGNLTYYYILHNRITSYHVDCIDHTKTMHLHNNEWVLGSLEHKNICCSGCEELLKNCECNGKLNANYHPKPIERITMAEVKYALNDYEFWPLSQIEVMEELKAYIEYLEANQKEKQ